MSFYFYAVEFTLDNVFVGRFSDVYASEHPPDVAFYALSQRMQTKAEGRGQRA